MDILKTITLVLICLAVCILIKQIKPEFLPFIQITTIILVAIMIMDKFKEVIGNMTAIAANGEVIEDEYIFLLVRILGISIVVKLSSDLCKDNGNSALAYAIELVGKSVIFAMCLPLIKVITELAVGLLE